MALKTSEQRDKTPAESAAAAQPVAPVVHTTVLELTMYKNYTWMGHTYEKGKPYRFKSEDAMRLLQEQDTGRPVWKIYSPPRIKKSAQPEIADFTNVDMTVGTEASAQLPPPSRRIDIGDDSEISDVLGRPDGEDVTV